MEYILDGEVFVIEKIEDGLNKSNIGKYKTSYRTERGARTGTLVIEPTVKKVETVLIKASKKNKIYSH